MGEVVCLDPLAWLRAGLVTNPGVFVLGQPGTGKSALVKRLVTGTVCFGATVLILGDTKPDYTLLTGHLGGQVIRIGRGLDKSTPSTPANPAHRESSRTPVTPPGPVRPWRVLPKIVICVPGGRAPPLAPSSGIGATVVGVVSRAVRRSFRFPRRQQMTSPIRPNVRSSACPDHRRNPDESACSSATTGRPRAGTELAAHLRRAPMVCDLADGGPLGAVRGKGRRHGDHVGHGEQAPAEHPATPGGNWPGHLHLRSAGRADTHATPGRRGTAWLPVCRDHMASASWTAG
jgi:hypothetical protein